MVRIGIVSQTDQISKSVLEKTVSALNYQLVNHYTPYWAKEAHVEIFNNLNAIPAGYYQVTIQDEIDSTEFNGYHSYEGNRVFAKVKFNDRWQYTLSHETIEMIQNPFLKEFRKSKAYNDSDSDPMYVEEIADATNSIGYQIEGVEVSNFVTPDWYNATYKAGIKYDFMGLLKQPRELYEGGYISFMDVKGEYWQALKVKGLLLFRKLTGKDVAVSAKDNPFNWILPVGIGLFVITIYLIIRKSKN